MVTVGLLPIILVVDDEPQILSALADTLEDEFKVLLAESPGEAIDILGKTPDLSVIISDQRMPGLSGHEFFTRARAISDATRILITGYSDLEAVIAAVNTARIFGYVSKPWDPVKLKHFVHQAAEHWTLQRALAEEQRLLHGLMNNMPDLIYFKDRDQRFLRANMAYADSLGIPDHAELVGRRLEDFIPATPVRPLAEEEAQVLRTGVPVIDRSSRMESKAGGPAWLSTTLAPLWDEQLQVAGLVAIARDVTARWNVQEELRHAHDQLGQRVAELTRAHEKLHRAYARVETQAEALAASSAALRQARQLAEAASEAKSQFLATMSHELRTPLTSLIGFSQLLLSETLDPAEFRRLLELQQEAAQTLHALVANILDFSKIEAGRLELEIVPSDLRALVSGCVELLAGMAGAKNVALDVSIDPGVPAWLQGDPTRLRQIVLNLLSNALKFTDAGQVSLTATRVAGAAGEEWLRVGVRDTGIGIPAARREELFQPFTQFENAAGRRSGGTGLGLTICKELVQRMGGRIGVESRLGEGSHFWFEIPLRRSPEGALGAPAGPAGGKRRPRKILVAEDNEMIQYLLATVLRGDGHEVEIAGDGLAALAAARSGDFDLVLMDTRMPELNGLEATRRIRAAEGGGRHLPIIALTANATEQDIQKSREAGVDLFMAKPVDVQLLLNNIAALCGEKVA